MKSTSPEMLQEEKRKLILAEHLPRAFHSPQGDNSMQRCVCRAPEPHCLRSSPGSVTC